MLDLLMKVFFILLFLSITDFLKYLFSKLIPWRVIEHFCLKSAAFLNMASDLPSFFSGGEGEEVPEKETDLRVSS